MVASTTLLSWQTRSTQLCYGTLHHHTPSVISTAEQIYPQSKHTQISLPNVHIANTYKHEHFSLHGKNGTL
jgi:hypothetical protein